MCLVVIGKRWKLNEVQVKMAEVFLLDGLLSKAMQIDLLCLSVPMQAFHFHPDKNIIKKTVCKVLSNRVCHLNRKLREAMFLSTQK